MFKVGLHRLRVICKETVLNRELDLLLNIQKDRLKMHSYRIHKNQALTWKSKKIDKEAQSNHFIQKIPLTKESSLLIRMPRSNSK
jgi:hypothetical protein